MPHAESRRRTEPQSTARARLKVTSPAFAEGAPIPKRHTADGDDASPHIIWTEPPKGTECFALLCEDPDAPAGSFVHWLIWNVPASQREVAEDIPATKHSNGMGQGRNSFGKIGYGGPSPPPGKPHRYVFRLYALDTKLDLPAGARRADFERALEGHVLAEGTLIGTYGR